MKILTYCGGCGIDAIDPDRQVELRFADKTCIMFAREVMSLYNKITCEKAIWTLTLPAELVECHYFIDSDDKVDDGLPF